MKIICAISVIFFWALAAFGQSDSAHHVQDSLKAIKLGIAEIEGKYDNGFGIHRLKQVEGTAIYAGKKSEVILLGETNGNLATNNSRQVYAKVAGLNVWESDGAGIQLGIGGRGMNPNRVSNFNTRQNGYDISADALGYPESYYTPPAEALDRIEVVRGASSLQYGTQFGGFVNFRMKQGPVDKKAQLTLRQTTGSFGFYNAFQSLGGKIGKLNYYSFYQYKSGKGWRPNSGFEVHTAYAGLEFRFTPKLQLRFEQTFMSYLAQQPGGLTDKEFVENPAQSNRSRNWFHINWNLSALILDYHFSTTARLNWRTFGLHAQRDALGDLGRIDRPDGNTNRNFLNDKFRNFGSELRYLKHYSLLRKVTGTLLVGSRYYQGRTYRKQGLGSAESGPDFTYLNPKNLEHSDYTFPSRNASVFCENIFRPVKNLTITPGMRAEYIHTQSEGYYNEEYRDMAGNVIYKNQVNDNRESSRRFLLAGVGIGYRMAKFIDWYANISQNYRSINFNDMRIVNPNAKVDPNLKDEKGYSADFGVRGKLKSLLNFDVSVFYLKYNNRIGSIQKTDSNTFQIYRLRTNISDSRNVGIETFAELDLFEFCGGKHKKWRSSVFINYALINATYFNSMDAAVKNGNSVEYVPSHILRTGLTQCIHNLKLTLQYAYTGEQFTEATNAVYTSNAVDGIIPAYSVIDLTAQYSWKRYNLAATVNNMANAMYFTRRADGYPGPGIIPADKRGIYLTLQVQLD